MLTSLTTQKQAKIKTKREKKSSNPLTAFEMKSDSSKPEESNSTLGKRTAVLE
jgi:hypothetical protein